MTRDFAGARRRDAVAMSVGTAGSVAVAGLRGVVGARNVHAA